MTPRLPTPRTLDPHDAPVLRWGILAPGGIAAAFCDALRRGTTQQIVAVGSRDLGRAETFAREWGVDAAYGSYAELVDDPRVDVVYVASPHSGHHEQARLALAAGKHVLVEKAFTRNAAEARDLVAVAREQNRFLLEAMWSRFLPHYDVIRQAVADGLLGEITTVFADHGQPLHPDGPERLANPALAGGALLDLGIYPISFAELVLGPPARVTATGTLTDEGVDSQEVVTVVGASGAMGVLHASMSGRTPCVASICGTEARIDVADTFYMPTAVSLHDRDGAVLDRHEPPVDVSHRGLRYEAAEVARCIAAGATESPLLPLATSVQIMETLDTVRAQLGVRFPGE